MLTCVPCPTPESRARDAQRLARESGVAEEVVRFALLGDGMGNGRGAAWNALLLSTVGERVLCVTGDAAACTGMPRRNLEKRAFISDTDARRIRFHRSLVEARDGIAWTGVDVAREHDRVLGASPDLLIAREGANRVALDWKGADIAPDADDPRRRGHIVVTVNGIAGRTEESWPHALLWLKSASPAASGWEAETYERACTHPVVTCTVDRLTLSTVFPSAPQPVLGLHNEEGLPPFLPVGWEPERAYGPLLRMCVPRGLAAYLPVTVARGSPRVFPRGLVRAYPGWSLGAIVASLFRAVGREMDAWPAADRLARLGARLTDLARLSRDEFRDQMTMHLARELARMLRALDTAVRNSGERPVYWAADARAYADSARAVFAKPVPFWPRDIGHVASPTDALDRCQRLFHLYARLLQSWPALVDAARSRSQRQARLRERVSRP